MVLLVSLVGLGEACSGAVGFIVLHAGAFRALGTSRLGTWWGFCTTWSSPAACHRRVAVLMTLFPPFGGAITAWRSAWWPSCRAIPPVWWWRGRNVRWCARQSADPL